MLRLLVAEPWRWQYNTSWGRVVAVRAEQEHKVLTPHGALVGLEKLSAPTRYWRCHQPP